MAELDDGRQVVISPSSYHEDLSRDSFLVGVANVVVHSRNAVSEHAVTRDISIVLSTCMAKSFTSSIAI